MNPESSMTEMASNDSFTAFIRICRCLPDLSQSVILIFLVSTVIRVTRLIPDPLSNLLTATRFHFAGVDVTTTSIGGSLLLLSIPAALRWKRSRPVYLVEFACYKPDGDAQKFPADAYMKFNEDSGAFHEDALRFQDKILRRSGIGDESYMPAGVTSCSPPNLSLAAALAEAEAVMIGALDALLEKTAVNPNEIDFLIVNCCIFSPTPSLSDMIVNHYKLRTDVKSYSLTGMGCSAGVISMALAKDLLKANPNSNAVVLSTENITLNWYHGRERSMLLTNCLFRMGGAAVLLSNKGRDRTRSKYELVHTVRTHTGADDRSYNCVYQREDDAGKLGVSLGRELPAVAGDALRVNIMSLGPLVLPFSEQLAFLLSLVRKKVMKSEVKLYAPEFEVAFEHFCVHAGGKGVLEAVQKNLRLSEWHMEPSRMTLHRFGNTSSSSLWYELAYVEAKNRVSTGDRVWQIAFGSGFKCNSAVWKAVRCISVQPGDRVNPWLDCIGDYPVHLED